METRTTQRSDNFKIVPAFSYHSQLSELLVLAGANPENQWFFGDGAFTAENSLERSPNTWLHENFVVIYDGKIICYLEGLWSRPLDIISNFRTIVFDPKYGYIAFKAWIRYMDYLFSARGCFVVNWIVAERNKHAVRLYEKLESWYGARCTGWRSRGIKGYAGDYSDVLLYELRRDDWENAKAKRLG